jgi:hypothetical protein
MRRRNWRPVIAGLLLIILTLGFYFFMLTIAPQSTNSMSLMQTVGTVDGVAIGISLAMIVVGLIGKKV